MVINTKNTLIFLYTNIENDFARYINNEGGAKTMYTSRICVSSLHYVFDSARDRNIEIDKVVIIQIRSERGCI